MGLGGWEVIVLVGLFNGWTRWQTHMLHHYILEISRKIHSSFSWGFVHVIQQSIIIFSPVIIQAWMEVAFVHLYEDTARFKSQSKSYSSLEWNVLAG